MVVDVGEIHSIHFVESPEGVGAVTKISHYEVWQHGQRVAAVDGPKDQALANAMHYALMYRQDGPVEVHRYEKGKRVELVMKASQFRM